MAKRLGKEEARQGRTGKGVRYVLGASLILAVVAFVIAFIAVD